MNKLTRSLLFVCAAIGLLGNGAPPAAELSAGAARVDLTPPLELGAPLGGYGARMGRPAEGIHDRVFAKALVLSDGTKKFGLITLDIVGLPPPLKPALVERLEEDGWTADQLLLLPSHSHTSIEMNAINPANTFDVPQLGLYNPKLFEFVLERLEQAVRDAGRVLVPVAIGTSSIEIEGWNRNRRGSPTTDNTLTVTRIDRRDGRPLAVFVHFTAHPTFLSADEMVFSGDWPGHLQRTLEALIGPDVIAMYANGAEGDQSPVPRPDSGPSRWERVERYGRELALVAWKQWQSTGTQHEVPFEFRSQSISLPERRWHPAFRQTGGAEYGLTEELLRDMLPQLFPSEVDVVSLRLGDLLILGVPGEMAASLGLQIKDAARQATGARHPVIGGLADLWISYILPVEEYRRGGYEASVSFYGEELGPTIVEGVLQGIED